MPWWLLKKRIEMLNEWMINRKVDLTGYTYSPGATGGECKSHFKKKNRQGFDLKKKNPWTSLYDLTTITKWSFYNISYVIDGCPNPCQPLDGSHYFKIMECAVAETRPLWEDNDGSWGGCCTRILLVISRPDAKRMEALSRLLCKKIACSHSNQVRMTVTQTHTQREGDVGSQSESSLGFGPACTPRSL